MELLIILIAKMIATILGVLSIAISI